MLCLHVISRVGQGSEFQLTYTSFKSISEYFTLLCYIYFTLASHITKIQRVEMNHGRWTKYGKGKEEMQHLWEEPCF